jgi:hypothetical protein
VNAGAGLAFTLPNQLTANHATTSTDARKPSIGAASNGVPILVCNTSCLQVPLHAGINGATKWGFSFHGRITSAAGNPVPFSIDSGTGGASARKVFAQRFAGDRAHVFNSASSAARALGPATMWELNVWHHYTLELNLDSGGAEADRGLWRVDGVPIVSAFTDSTGTPGSLPVAMPQPTGFLNLFAQAAATGNNSWVGEVANIILYSDSMPGSRCLLTDAAALAVSAFNRPA